MLSVRRPTDESIRRFLAAQARLDFSYSAVGATATTPPVGYTVDRTRIKLGESEDVFNSAVAALQRWEHFRLGWTEALPADTPIQTEAVVGVLAHAFGVWWLNACRIVYVVDEHGPITRYGFAYGTLPDHAESGEERFTVDWNQSDNGVWYDILAFSRPNLLLTRIGYPFVRRFQKRFARDSAAQMLRVAQAVSPNSGSGPV